MSQFFHVGGAIIPAANRDEANNNLNRQGYGPNNFSVPLEEVNPPHAVTHYGCYMPMNSALFTAVNQVVTEHGGEWVEPAAVQQASVSGETERKLLYIAKLLRILKLRIRR